MSDEFNRQLNKLIYDWDTFFIAFMMAPGTSVAGRVSKECRNAVNHLLRLWHNVKSDKNRRLPVDDFFTMVEYHTVISTELSEMPEWTEYIQSSLRFRLTLMSTLMTN